MISYFPEQAELIDVGLSVNDNSAEYEVNTVTKEKFKMSKFPENFQNNEAWTKWLTRNNNLYRKLL